tara:strand:+ start:302 stop:433 length:132 start_codon:yes stop_codon:yes gene_type:complete
LFNKKSLKVKKFKSWISDKVSESETLEALKTFNFKTKVNGIKR